MPGIMRTYQSIDVGKTHSAKCLYRASKRLQLKPACPVILTKTISSSLVNGTLGEVVSVTPSGPTVKFFCKPHSVTVNLERTSFSGI